MITSAIMAEDKSSSKILGLMKVSINSNLCRRIFMNKCVLLCYTSN